MKKYRMKQGVPPHMILTLTEAVKINGKEVSGNRVKVQAGDTFEGAERYIRGVIDKFDIIGGANDPEADEAPVKAGFTLKRVARKKGVIGDRFNIINETTGEQLNDDPMTKEDANKFIADNGIMVK